MAPRRYTLGRRAETAAATREAIVDAAMTVYFELGTERTTLKAIAQRADVSRGTILHHFGDADGLLEAVLDRILATLVLPDVGVLDGLTDREARVRTFVHELVTFTRRSTPWWRIFEAEMGRPVFQAREAQYFAALGRLQAAALGPELAGDPAVQVGLGAIVHPGTVGSILWVLETAGVSGDAASRVIEDLVVGYLRERGGSKPAGERARDPGSM
ncbi:MAG TPA: TetR/AcrR family transcriptional regulator [Candidatus Limnocylindrales bacterium]|nr:TetR/AcrR family transcriptional regulator [Candidatus Limnocylindrales bacterium]